MRVLHLSSGTPADDLLQAALAARGHDVVQLDDARQALGRLSDESFDLVALHWSPERSDRPHLVQWLRAQPGGERACLLLLVSRDDAPSVEPTLPEGPVEFLFHPVDPHVLGLRLVSVERMVHTWSSEPRAHDPTGDELARIVVEQAPIGLALFQEGGELLASRSLARLTGYSSDELSSMGVLGVRKLIHADDIGEILRTARATLTGATAPRWSRFRLIRKDGRSIWVEGHGASLEVGGKPATIFCYLDITDRKAREDELRASQHRLSTILQHLPVLISASDADGRIVHWNREAERVSGWSAAQLVDNPAATELMYPDEDYRAEMTARAREAMTADGFREVEWELTRPDGEHRWVSWSSVRLPEALGDWAHLYIGIDVTEHHRAQQALKDSEEGFRTLVENAPEAIVVMDADTGKFIDCNANVLRLFGVDRATLLASGPADFSPPVQPDGTPSDLGSLSKIGEALEGGQPFFDWTHRNAAGEDIECELRLVRLPAKDRNIVRGSITDVSWRREEQRALSQLEEALQQSQKMEAIGRLAGGVAHDFNNLLTGILACAADLQEASDPQVLRAAHTIEQAADRAAELTRQLLGFARRGKYRTYAVAADEVLEAVVRLVARTAGKRVQIEHEPAPPGAVIQGDPGQLEQVFLNLAVNACDAMAEGGRLRVSSSCVILDEQMGPPEAGGHTGRFVRIAMEDSGHGVPEGDLVRIFEPFFTTKPPGQGTGMGLAMVYGIVQNHGGWVDVESELGVGTTFTVWLPASEGAADVRSVPGANRTGKTDRVIRVLVVDDEPVVRDTLDNLLSRLGYIVDTAGSGEEAVAWFSEADNEVDVVVIDMVMPGMNGQECFFALRSIDPDVRAVLSTGYGLDGAVRSILAEGMRGFVQKPYRIGDLAEVLERAVDD